MSTVANYSGRSVDIACFQGIKPKGEVEIETQLFSDNNGGEVCAGIQKLIQRWLLIFLTPKGSMKFQKDRGTTFLTDMLNVYSTSDVMSAFRFANMEAVSQLVEEETSDMTNDERIKSVVLQSVSFEDDYFVLKVKVISRAGSAPAILVPISTNPLNL